MLTIRQEIWMKAISELFRAGWSFGKDCLDGHTIYDKADLVLGEFDKRWPMEKAEEDKATEIRKEWHT